MPNKAIKQKKLHFYVRGTTQFSIWLDSSTFDELSQLTQLKYLHFTRCIKNTLTHISLINLTQWIVGIWVNMGTYTVTKKSHRGIPPLHFFLPLLLLILLCCRWFNIPFHFVNTYSYMAVWSVNRIQQKSVGYFLFALF